MATKNSVSDPYLESITAQIKEKDDQIKAASKRLFEEKAHLEAIRAHYIKFKKMMMDGK